MDSIFYGLVLAFLDLNVNSFDILPDWAGYLLMYRGLGQLAAESRRFSSARPWCIGMAVFTLLLVFTRFSGTSGTILSSALGIICTVIFLYILYCLTQGVEDLQALYPEANLELPMLQRRWRTVCVLSVATYAFSLLSSNGLAVGILTLVGLVVYILFLMTFHRCRQAYYAARTARPTDTE